MLHEGSVSLQVSHVQIKNFRCFETLDLVFEKPIVLIEGDNGVGKTSLLEALYYACYLRSFRTSSPREMIRFGHDTFFVKIAINNKEIDQPLTHDIQVGFSKGKRLVKVDQKTVSSYKQLMQHYRIISLTEDDLQLVQGAPQMRRTFIDQVLLLDNPEYIAQLRVYRQILDQRNALLHQHHIDKNVYDILTTQLWEKSKEIQQQRIDALRILHDKICIIIDTNFGGNIKLDFKYRAKKGMHEDLGVFLAENANLFHDEKRFRRSLFGAHLDDFIITFQDAHSRNYASRGQQKLIVLLLKFAQAQFVAQKHGPSVFFLDDFMTDFDLSRAQILLKTLNSLENQLIFTCPIRSGVLSEYLQEYDSQSVSLTG